MKIILTILVAFSFSISTSFGQFNASFEEFLEEAVVFIEDEINPIGLSISLRTGDKEWSRTIGISSSEDSLTTSSIFAMGSITKTFVSAGILKMMEEERLSLSDPLHLYLPSFEFIDSTVTIEQLLNHTSGFYNYTSNPIYFDFIGTDENQVYNFSPEEVLEKFVLEEVFEKGTDQQYSNTNYLLLGMIITEIAGRPYYEEIFEFFAIPQNYPTINCPPFTSDLNDLVDVWYDLGGGTINLSELGVQLNGLFTTAGSAGAFVGTASDVSQWGYDLYSGKLLSQSSMDLLFDFHPFLLDDIDDYGLGVFGITTSCGVNAVGHGGNILYEADLAYSEELDLSVAIMTNDEIGFYDFGGVSTITDEIFCAYKNSLTTSLVDKTNTEDVEISPNLITDIFTIQLPQKFDQNVQVEVYNEIGSLIYTKKFLKTHAQILSIDCLSNQARGLYFVKIHNEDYSYVEKLIKT